MGNMGGIEKLMVFGVLLIIVTILVIPFFGTGSEDEPYAPGATGDESFDDYFREDVAAKTQEPFPEDVPVDAENEGLVPEGMEALPLKRAASIGGASGREPGAGAAEASAPRDDAAPAPRPAGPRKYVVKQGDSFARIARVELGDEKWTTAISKVNPNLDPLGLKVGDEILLPDVAELTAPAEPPAAAKGAAKPPAANVYIVKENDTLYRIATRVLGDKRQWKKIYEANRDILLDPHSLIPGMELRIPEAD